MAKAAPCVLAIFDPSGQGGGSGVGHLRRRFRHDQLPRHYTPAATAMQCGMADGKVYDAVIVGLDPTGDIAMIKLLGRNDFPHAELGDSDKLRAGDWVFAMGNPVPPGHRLPAYRHQRHHLRHASLPVPRRHAAGIRRLPADRRLDQSGQFRRPAVQRPGQRRGHQRPLLVRQARPRERRRGLQRLHQPDQELSRRAAQRADRRSRHARRPRRLGRCKAACVVSDILESCDAYRRGLRTDDEIVSFAGRPISTPNGFKNALGIYPKGWQVPLTSAAKTRPPRPTSAWPACTAATDLIEKTLGPARTAAAQARRERLPGAHRPRTPRMPQMEPPKRRCPRR